MENSESLHKLDAWTPEQTAKYLLESFGGKSKFLSKNLFPRQIDFSLVDHSFDDVWWAGQDTGQTKETFSLIGGTLDGRIISHDPIIGKQYSIDLADINAAREHILATQKAKKGFLLVHSHPINDPNLIATLSPADLYTIIKQPEEYTGIVAAQGKQNVVALCTRDTTKLPFFQNTQENFLKHWYSTNGWRYERGKNNEDLSKQLPGGKRISEISTLIANDYKIVLYKGEAVGPLTRIN